MAERKDAKFWAQAVRRVPTTPIAPTAPEVRRPWVSTAHLYISTPGIERTTLTHAGVHRSAPHLDAVRHILHLAYGSTAGVRIETSWALLELLVFYINATPNQQAAILLQTGKQIQTSRIAGRDKYSMPDATKATLSPYRDDYVEFGGLSIRSVTDVL